MFEIGGKGIQRGYKGDPNGYTLVSANILIYLCGGHVTNMDNLLFQISNTYSNTNMSHLVTCLGL